MEVKEVNGQLPDGKLNGCDSGTDSSTFDITSTDSDPSTATVTSVTSQTDSQSQLEYLETNCQVNGHTKIKEMDQDSLSLDLSKSDSQDLDLSISSSDKENIKDETLTNTKPQSCLPKLDKPDWYLNPCFQNYWQHYYHCMAWFHRHNSVTKNLTQPQSTGGFPPGGPPAMARLPWAGVASSYKWPNSGCPPRENPYHMGARHRGKNRRKGNGRGRGHRGAQHHSHVRNTCNGQVLTEEKSLTSQENQQGSDSDSEVFEMEITDDMVEFFTKSEQHKKERDAKKTEETKEDSRLDLEGANATKKAPTTAAPLERPGVRRTQEMVLLYGKGAAMVHGMETAMQMSYDRNMDILQPKYWPNMPLKISFS
ncbi:gem-associated protein 8-like [Mizuhopecten yessoensis]|uniref:Gem-associated protein 8 n=1 Tax=Mizuhopecten yessoensis TaxID=6573 RepID=A0A210QVT7_MIZYE|nr:gem-associated protein 8-like [Mizuhopecten yessoensis]OWF52878.1 Gem-associated protein 8 [Mizuhopecten yessoensis]